METNSDFRDERSRLREERQAMRRDHHVVTSNRALIGVVLVLAGLFLVMKNTGIFPEFLDNVVFSWPMLLVVIGLVMTLGSSEKTGGIIVMAVGGFFMIPLIFRETFHMYNMFWPSIFIIVGVIFIVSRRTWRSGMPHSEGAATGAVTGDDWIDYVNIFSGGERQVTSQVFKGGKITSIFGGIELDLTKAQLQQGDSVIEIACIFGGATLIVPDNWFITIEVTPVLGGFSDSRKLMPGRTVDPSRHLIIKGAVVFGGGEIKSY
jgi:predicted membrane protein